MRKIDADGDRVEYILNGQVLNKYCTVPTQSCTSDQYIQKCPSNQLNDTFYRDLDALIVGK